MVKAAQARLTEMSQRALQMHRTKGTQDHILRAHNAWQYELGTVELNHQPVEESRVAAFTEMMEMTEILVTERGMDPDSILHWLDLFPSVVLNVHLGVQQPNTV